MRRTLSIAVAAWLASMTLLAQTPPSPEKDEEVIRISTNLVQTYVVVTDDGNKPIADLKLEDFELSDDGKKQDLSLVEFVSTEGTAE